MCIIDAACRNEELRREIALRERKPEGPAETGHCLNCGPDAPLPPGQRWCDTDCRDDWEARQR